jgi:hypothetical protein
MFRTVRGVLTAGILLAGLQPLTAHARPATPDLPSDLEVGEGFTPFLRAHAAGTQNYICLATASGVAWRFTGPQATLFVTFPGGFDQQVTTHFLSPNPEEGGTPRPTWQLSLDTSRVWGRVVKTVDDPAVIGSSAIPWLLLERAGAQAGPEGGSRLAQTRYIQRINTAGGKAPATGCAQIADAGAVALVPYTTDYVFFKAARTR